MCIFQVLCDTANATVQRHRLELGTLCMGPESMALVWMWESEKVQESMTFASPIVLILDATGQFGKVGSKTAYSLMLKI